MKNILVPIDGSKFSLTAIEHAKTLATAFQSNIVLLNVIEKTPVDQPSHPYKFLPDVMKKAGEEHAQRKELSMKILAQGEEMLSGIPGKVKSVSLEGDPADLILEYSDMNKFDLIIMGSKGISGIQSILIGSVTRKVALHINIPILIIK